MVSQTPRYIESLEKARKNRRIADHMAYMTYPMMKDKRLLLKIVDEIYSALISSMNAILQYEYLKKRINLSNDADQNLNLLFEKCAQRYGISNEDIYSVREFFSIYGQHKKSPMEFQRKDKIVLMSDDFRTKIIDLEKIKKYIFLARKIEEKAGFVFNQGF
jgi:hypothetical protein